MTTSEPTTGDYTPDELIGAVRWCWVNHETSGCYGCPLEHKPCDGLETALADCLERINMENVDLCIDCGGMTETIASCRDIIESHEHTIAALTARAEQAEAERDAAIKDITRLCTRCKHWTCPNDDEPCLSCLNAESGNPNWTWRGLPQEGGGK